MIQGMELRNFAPGTISIYVNWGSLPYIENLGLLW